MFNIKNSFKKLHLIVTSVYIFSLIYYYFKYRIFKYNFFKTSKSLASFSFKCQKLVTHVKYFFNVWIYSTNHKRISINYFWFVLLAGVVGMVLATLIRAEMAYPGIGILAGDNSQYLSIVSAHGVIMVFFMAMPLLFGFFTNFLLPTQLGVHDVAFPRMNSAAFWFLPASLIVLAQLVCVDRRYQRMNCFNIRELQSLLRKRFFFELLNENQYNTVLNQTSLSERFFNNNEYINKNTNLIFNFYNLYINTVKMTTLQTSSYQYNKAVKQTSSILNFINKFLFILWENLKFFIKTLINTYRDESEDDLHILSNLIFDIINIYNIFWFNINTFKSVQNTTTFDKNLFTSFNYTYNTLFNNFLETYYNNRFLQYQNPEFLFKVKIGNYLPDKPFLKNFDYLINTLSLKTVQNKESYWLNSRIINTFLNTKNNFWSFDLLKKSEVFNFINWDADSTLKWSAFLYSHMDIFFFTNYLLLNSYFLNLINIRWSFSNFLDSYFNKLFFSQNKQLFIFNNWKNLKLSREGWRCRLLLARNQNSLYKRYTNESDLLWVVEKNAKDLIPGWAMITPFSSRTKYTLIGKTDIGLWVVVFTLISSIISCSNFIMTYRYLSTLNNRKMRDARSFFSEAILATCWMTICANPMLILGILMLLSDRHWKTSFFDYSGGGDTVLFQHMFWFFGHPEVYIIIVPCFGFVNTILSFYLRKRISARASLMYSIYTIAFLGFFVWGHHMYMVGLAHTTRMLYSTLTVMISVPAATKIMHWLVTFVNSSVHMELPLVFILSFIFFFLSGGISGMSVAHTGMDVLFHDTFFVVGHFHVMLAGSLMFSGFAGVYFYLPAIFGVRYNRLFAYLHYIYYTIGQLFTVIPMIWLGYAGMPRRVLDYPAAMGGWHSLATSAHMLSVAGILCFVVMLFDSLRKKKAYIIKTFGVGRYNTRLNFYLYEIHRNKYWLMKSQTLQNNTIYKINYKTYNKLINYELYESTLFYYTWK